MARLLLHVLYAFVAWIMVGLLCYIAAREMLAIWRRR